MQNSPARSAIDVGSVIADTYTIEALIGRGGMGAVFLASHRRLPGKKVAIKMLHAEMAGDEVLARFKREAEIASRLGHPNIVQVHDFNVLPDGTPYLVLEYLHGESLANRLTRGPLGMDQAVSIIRQVGSALAAAHREGIVHRDLKPQNIFLVPTEVEGRTVEIAKVLDFGISKIRGSQTVKTQDSVLLGTPQYMAPEQATGQHRIVDERTDVFAFGAIVYEMLSGKPAFSGETIPEVVFKVVYEEPAPLASDVPAPIANAVRRAMAKQPEERFANVSELVEAVTGAPLATRRPTSIPPPELGFATGSRAPHTGNDAFAQTMGSVEREPPKVGPTSTTVDSRGLAGPTRSMQGPAPRSRGWILAIVLAGAAIAGVAMFLVLRGNHRATHSEAPKEPGAVAVATVDAAVVVAVDAAVAVANVDAAVPAPAHAPDDAAVAKAKPRGKPEAPREAEPGGDEAAAGKLREAMAALDAGKLSLAETVALGVTSSEYASATQRAQGKMIYGIARCKNRDEERAQTVARELESYKALRAKLVEACHREGYLQGVAK